MVPAPNKGIIDVPSNRSFEQTVDRLKNEQIEKDLVNPVWKVLDRYVSSLSETL